MGYWQEVRNTSKYLQSVVAGFLRYKLHVGSVDGSKQSALKQISATTDFTGQLTDILAPMNINTQLNDIHL